MPRNRDETYHGQHRTLQQKALKLGLVDGVIEATFERVSGAGPVGWRDHQEMTSFPWCTEKRRAQR
jgi:hypothetical protein